MKKFKTVFIVAGAIAVICICLVIASLCTLVLNTRLNKKVLSSENYLQKYEKVLTEFPYQAVDRQKLAKRKILQEYLALKREFRSSVIDEPVSQTPLYFKQKLFEVQDSLQIKAEEKKLILPELIGFLEYQVSLPQQNQTGLLLQELVMVNEIINELLCGDVFAVNEIKLTHESIVYAPDKNLKEQNSGITFEAIPVFLKIETTFESLRKFLQVISEKDNSYMLKKLDIKSKDNQTNRILVYLKIENIKITGK
ncbi:MAG: hypothetical protein ABIG64_06215 [Candidatus Omnitrophota bacterium]